MNRIPTHEMVRELPTDARIVKTENGIDLYNMTIFQNIMSWNQHNLDITAFEYFGTTISYGQLPFTVEEYIRAFRALGIKERSVVTLSLPVMIEYYISLFALGEMGAISNNPSILFLKNDIAKYTLDKNSDTLIILDVFLPLIAEHLEEAHLKNIILISYSDYLPEGKKDILNDPALMPKKVRDILLDKQELNRRNDLIRNIKDVRICPLQYLLELGRASSKEIKYPVFDIDRVSMYSYTSGTTGDPKCVVYTEQSANAIVEMHKGLNLRDYVGDRSLVVIPPGHTTGLYFAAYLQLSKGKTMVLQPIYDKKTFARDLRDFKVNHTLAAASFYLEAVAQNNLKPGDLASLSRPCSGGEPISKCNADMINDWLKNAGSPEKIAIGGGSSEVGSSAITSYELNPETKTNETGYPIPGVVVKIINPKTGREVERGQRGQLHISSPAAAKGYLVRGEINEDFYYYQDGYRWANLGDITVQNEDGSYSMLGRASDSYVDEEGKIHYLFDIEYSVEASDPVVEWEITAFKTTEGHDIVGQVVVKKEYIGKEEEVIRFLCAKYKLDGIKIYDQFTTGEVTGKRDYLLLKNDRTNYFCPAGPEYLYKKTYNENGFVDIVKRKGYDYTSINKN